MTDKQLEKIVLKQIANRIKHARMHRSMTLEELAGHDFDIKFLRRVEAGEEPLLFTDLKDLSVRLDVSLFYLIGDADLLEWFDDQEFIQKYRMLKHRARFQVKNLVCNLIEELPVLR